MPNYYSRNRFILSFISVTMVSLTLVYLSCYAASKVKHKFVDPNVAGVVVGKSTKHQVIRLLGKGMPIKDCYSYLYFNPKQQASMRIDFFDGCLTTITISDKSLSEYPGKGKLISKSLSTGKGIQLGDSIQKIKKLYGKPDESKKEKGLVTLIYRTDTYNDPDVGLDYDAYLTLKNDKLVEISLHDGD